MKKYTLLLLLCGISVWAKAQIEHPVKWSYAAKRLNNNEATLYLKATMASPWHIYSTRQKEGGPVKTSFVFSPSKDYSLAGEVTEPKPITKFEKAFGIDVSYFENSVIFSQKIRLNKPVANVGGTITFMSCNDQKCLPPETISFNIPVK